jgi:hypothetical protein
MTLKGTGPSLWDLLERPISKEDLALTLARAYETDLTSVASDLEQSLQALVAAQVARWV